MGYSMRYATAAEFSAVAELDGASFGFHYTQQDLQDALLDVDPTALFIAMDGERIVGVSGEVPFTMTLPGGQLPVVGLTWVSVEITHRRRGILTAMVEQQLHNCIDRRVPVAILTASEGGIYGRHGFGSATDTRKVIVQRRRTRLLRPSLDHGVARMTTEQARALLPALHDRWRHDVPGALDRSEARWRLELLEREHQRDGMSGLFHLVHDGGYVSYRIKTDWNDGDPNHLCQIVDYVISKPEAHAGLWQVLLGMDLCATIESYRMPLDDPLPHLVDDPRQIRTAALNDGLWVRPLDACALLGARTYAVEIDIALRVIDPLLGDRTLRLRGGPDGATCEPANSLPEVEIGVADLGAISLGGRRVMPLVRAGRVHVENPATITRLDRAFLADVAPQYGTTF